jgi:hypothetical protein
MKIIAPLRGQSVAALLSRQQDLRVVQVALRDQPKLAAELFTRKADLILEFRQKVISAKIEYAVNRVEPQNINMVILEPEEGVFDEEPADMLALRPIEIDSLPPRCSISVSEIRPELGQIITFRAEVVVHDIERHREAMSVRGIHEPLKGARPSVTVLDRKRINAVVAPIA